MLGRAHALSGVTGWLGLCAGAAVLGHRPGWPSVVVGAAVAAGAALAPDIDHPGSTVSRALGPLTRILSWTTSFVADAVQDATCRHCKDPNRKAHRGLTHTAAGAVAFGALVALACRWLPTVAPFVVVFAFAALAVLGLLPGKRKAPRWALAVGLAAVGAGNSVAFGGSSWWWLGLPVTVGTLLHIWGDWLTKSGVPALWPLRIKGCRWYPLGAPWRFRAGDWREIWFVTPLLFACAIGAGWVLLR